LSPVVYLGELHRDQDGLPPEEAHPYPDVLWFVVPVHKHLLRAADLLTQRIVDRVPSASLRLRRVCAAQIGYIV
jgi:hypothetical protein